MILTQEQVIHLVETPQDAVIATNKQLQDDHKVHIQGVGFEDVLRQIIGYENVEQFKQKKLLTKPFSRPIFRKITRAQGRWKNAWGGTKFYNFTKNSEKLGKEFKTDILSQVWKNGSMDIFIKKFLAQAIYEEFNGLFLVEKGKVVDIDGKKFEVREGIATPLKDGENLKPYIVFISVDDIYKFKYSGDKVEFVVLRFDKFKRRNGQGQDVDVELFRVIDDVKDYIVEKEDNVVKISTEHTPIEHKAGRCPASTVTYITQTLTDDKTRTSPVDDIIKLLDYYLHQFAEHLVTEILHAHPNFYQVGQRCIEVVEGIQCDNGKISGISNKSNEEINIDCPACKGTGHNLKKDASTTLIIPAKDDEGKAFNITNVMGYTAPPIDALEYQERAIDWMEEKILSSALGINNVANSEKLEKTATEAVINLKPLEDIISDIIDIIEGVEATLTDIIGKMYYGDKYDKSEIIYGRKLSLRDENTLLIEIKNSKEAGVNNSHIKALNEELTYSRFVRSNYDLQRNVILNELEPLTGFTWEEVEQSKNVEESTKVLKQNFNDLINRFEREKGNVVEFEPGTELNKKIENILVILNGYVDEMEVGSEEPPAGMGE